MSFSKIWDCWKFVINQSCGIGFSLYWFQIIFCNKCNPCNSVKQVSFMCLLRLVVFLRGSRSAILVLVCWPRKVCVLRCSRSLSWLWCKWSRCDCLVDFLRVSEKTGCSSGFGVNQYKHLCAISLSLTL